MFTRLLYEEYLKSSGISTDSRVIADNKLFFALRGDNFDGNKFAEAAIKNGACRVVVNDPAIKSAYPEKTVVVEDTLAELQALASYHRNKLHCRVIAVTGTNGKTTTKELMASVLRRKYRVHATEGNLNNNIGVPLTILAASANTQIMIVEMGASHPGDIDFLCHIAEPDFGIVTCVGLAHLQGFGSLEGVIRTKTELYRYIDKRKGTVIYNDDNPVLKEQAERLACNKVTYSSPNGRAMDIKASMDEMYVSMNVNVEGNTYKINSHLFGSYNVENVKAAIAVGSYFNVDMADIVDAVEQYKPSNNRSQVVLSKRNSIICDSYNANPASMRKAVEAFSHIRANKKICILGDMLELGMNSEEEHYKIVNMLKNSNIDEALLVGEMFEKVVVADEFIKTFPNVGSLKDYLVKNPLSDSCILVKGSRGIRLETIYDLL